MSDTRDPILLARYEAMEERDWPSESVAIAQRFADAFEVVCPSYMGGYVPERLLEALELAGLELAETT